MKNTIETPKSCKIAKTEIIDGNLIVTYERDLPESVRDIPNRTYAVVGNKPFIIYNNFDLDQFSTKERAEAILALGQLLELAAYVGCEKFNYTFQFGLGKQDLANDFRKKYDDLFQKAKKLL